jgi:hypothetical protein
VGGGVWARLVPGEQAEQVLPEPPRVGVAAVHGGAIRPGGGGGASVAGPESAELGDVLVVDLEAGPSVCPELEVHVVPVDDGDDWRGRAGAAPMVAQRGKLGDARARAPHHFEGYVGGVLLAHPDS